MWKKELGADADSKVKNPVGSKDNWYNKAAEYWEVSYTINNIMKCVVES